MGWAVSTFDKQTNKNLQNTSKHITERRLKSFPKAFNISKWDAINNNRNLIRVDL